MTRIVFRRGSVAAWTAANPVLWESERGFESDTGRWKTGDGETPWNGLPYDLGADAVGDAVAAYLSEFPPGGTDLTFSRTGTTVTVLSATGTDAVLPAADGSNAGVMTSAQQVKLAGVATGATANDTDANLLNRANHTGSQASTTISDFTEAVQDAVAALLAAGTSVTLDYNDAGNTLTVNSTGGGGGLDAEAVRDAIGIALVGAGNVSVSVNDGADTITISTTATVNATDAALRDRSTHTGTQLASTISDFATAADARITAAPTTGTGSIVRAASPTFTGTVSGISKSMVGLASVDNTADTAKPVSTAQQTALDLKAPLASPTFTGTVSGVTKAMVGLGNVDNTADTAKPVSTLQQAALDALALVAANTQTGTTYTLVIGDASKVVEMNNASANTLTVPPNSSVAFPIGSIVEVYQYGVGQTTIAAGAGVTIRSAGAKLKITSQYSSVTLRKRATDEWVLAGDLSA